MGIPLGVKKAEGGGGGQGNRDGRGSENGVIESAKRRVEG